MSRAKAPASFGLLSLALLLLVATNSTQRLHAQTPSSVMVRMLDAIDSGKDAPGKQYRASVTTAVDAGNGVMIPEGAEATVTLVNAGSGSGWNTQLVSVMVNGQPVAVTSGPASVTAAAQSSAGRAVSSMNSVLSGLGHHVNAPPAATAIATGLRVLLPPGTTLTFVLSQPSAASPAAPAAPAGVATTAVPAGSAAPAPQPTHASPASAATAGQHWWICRYSDPKDQYKPAAGSRMYYAVFASSEPAPNALNTHFNGYMKQNYQLADFANSGNGFCKRVSDDVAGRAYSVDSFKKQWASSNMEPVEVAWADTPAQNAAIDAKLAGAASTRANAAATATAGPGQHYVWCHSDWGGVTGTKMAPGTLLYFSDIFAGTMPPPSGSRMQGADQRNDNYAFQAPFLAFLQKKYGYKEGGSCAAMYPPTLAGLQDAQKYKKDFEDMTVKMNGQVVETGWIGEAAPAGQGAAAHPAAKPPAASSGSNSKECSFHGTC